MIQPHPRISTLEYLIIFRAHNPGLTNLIHLTLLSAYRQMEWENLTSVLEFFLLGLSQQPEQQWPLFGLFLSMYLVTVTGNLLIILAITADAQLRTPMFFFLANLSLTDTCFVSTTVPKMLANIWAQNQVISYTGCLSQLYFFLMFGMLEASLLAVMAYDRYVAICYPLHYIMVMSPGLCVIHIVVRIYDIGRKQTLSKLLAVYKNSIKSKTADCNFSMLDNIEFSQNKIMTKIGRRYIFSR